MGGQNLERKKVERLTRSFPAGAKYGTKKRKDTGLASIKTLKTPNVLAGKTIRNKIRKKCLGWQ